MPVKLPGHQVSTGWLAERLDQTDVVVVDGSWYLPADQRDAYAEYREGHVPGAVFFDIDKIADDARGLPHMLPSPERFSEAMRDLGIANEMAVVVYDGMGLFSAARVWWTFRTFGHTEVAVLRGGLPRWKAEGRPLQAGAVSRPPAHFTPRLKPAAVAHAQAVLAAAQDGAAQILDARSAPRFRGEAPEPRPGVRAGHIPGSRNLPYTQLIEAGCLRPPAELAQAFQRSGVDLDKPLITTCGSGVTAAILTLAITELGRDPGRLYDGSWSEWGAREDLPIATGADR